MLHYYEDEEISGLQDLLMHFLVPGISWYNWERWGALSYPRLWPRASLPACPCCLPSSHLRISHKATWGSCSSGKSPCRAREVSPDQQLNIWGTPARGKTRKHHPSCPQRWKGEI